MLLAVPVEPHGITLDELAVVIMVAWAIGVLFVEGARAVIAWLEGAP